MRLDRLAASAADLFQPLAEEKGVVIRVEAAPVSVLGVRTLLQRPVTNLVDNAVKFSPRDGVVTLAVRLTRANLYSRSPIRGRAWIPSCSTTRAVSRAAGQGRESHRMGLAFVRAILKRHGAVMTIDDAGPGAVVTARFSR